MDDFGLALGEMDCDFWLSPESKMIKKSWEMMVKMPGGLPETGGPNGPGKLYFRQALLKNLAVRGFLCCQLIGVPTNAGRPKSKTGPGIRR